MDSQKYKKFVPYALAVKLKNLGFNEECIALYQKNKKFKFDKSFSINNFKKIVDGDEEHYIKHYPKEVFFFNGEYYITYCVGTVAPTWQDAFDWFRDTYNLDSYVRKITYREWKLEINYILQNDSEEEWKKSKSFIDFKNSQNDAREACLEKLIEIVEKQWKIV